MDMETLTVDAHGPVGHLTLSRPESLNPLSTQCLEELIAAASWFDDTDARVVIVSGEGRAFCAGADLAGFAGPSDRSPHDANDTGRRMVEAIERMRPVTIAAIQGHCVGGGVLLAVACDLRVAAAGTRFAIPEVDLGIPLTWGGIPRLVREIGPAMTRELVLTCRPFDAAEARELGLVNRVVRDDQLTSVVEELAGELAAKSALTLEATLRSVDEAAESLTSTAGAHADADLFVAAIADPESREVAAAYLAARRSRPSR